MATYNISMTAGTGVSSFTFYYYDSSNTYRGPVTSSSITVPAHSGTDVYISSVTFSSGYTYPVMCGGWTMYNSSGSAVDPYIRSNANRSLTISATKQAPTTKYRITLTAGTGVSDFDFYYYQNGTYYGPINSSSISFSADAGTKVYISNIYPDTNYGTPYYLGDGSKTWAWASDKYVDVVSARSVTVTGTLQTYTYYGRFTLNANGGSFRGAGYTSISWPTSGVMSGTGTGAAYVSTTLPVSGGNYVPTRDGYTFVGWATSAGGSVVYYSGATAGFTARSTSSGSPTVVTLYAVWEELADIELFYWNGSDTNDAALIAKGKEVKTAITATRWNNLLAKIKELADACGASFSYTTVSSGDGITAARFNAARTGLANIKTALGASITLPATQSSGDTIYATLFNGSTSIKGALNALIGVYNNG